MLSRYNQKDVIQSDPVGGWDGWPSTSGRKPRKGAGLSMSHLSKMILLGLKIHPKLVYRISQPSTVSSKAFTGTSGSEAQKREVAATRMQLLYRMRHGRGHGQCATGMGVSKNVVYLQNISICMLGWYGRMVIHLNFGGVSRFPLLFFQTKLWFPRWGLQTIAKFTHITWSILRLAIVYGEI